MSEWTTIGEGTSRDNIYSTGAIDELLPGTDVRITMELPWYLPVAPFLDMFGSESVANMFIDKARLKLIDVEGEGAYTIVCHSKVIGTPVHLILGGIAAILFATGLIIALIRVDAILPGTIELAKWIAIGGIGIGVIIIVNKLVKRRT